MLLQRRQPEHMFAIHDNVFPYPPHQQFILDCGIRAAFDAVLFVQVDWHTYELYPHACFRPRRQLVYFWVGWMAIMTANYAPCLHC